MKQTKRPERKARRKARRAKVKETLLQIAEMFDNVHNHLMEMEISLERIEAALETKREHEAYRKADAERAAKS